jgi:hypothetical protein
MLMVITLVMALLGLGIMAFVRGSRQFKVEGMVDEVALALRHARQEAASTQAPGFVTIEKDPEQGTTTLAAWGYRLVGMWHLEDGKKITAGAFNLNAHVNEAAFCPGKIGQGIRLVGQRTAKSRFAGHLDCGDHPSFDCENGGFLEAYIFGLADFLSPQFVFRKKDCFALCVGRGGVLTGMVGKEEVRAKDYFIRPRRWTKVGMVWNESLIFLLADDAVVATGPGGPTPIKETSLLIGDDKMTFMGMVDEPRILAAVLGPKVRVPPQIEVTHNAAPWPRIHFAPDGGLDPRFHPGSLTVQFTQARGDTSTRKRYGIEISQLGLTRRLEMQSIGEEGEVIEEQAAKPQGPKKVYLIPADQQKPLPSPGEAPPAGQPKEGG